MERITWNHYALSSLPRDHEVLGKLTGKVLDDNGVILVQLIPLASSDDDHAGE